MSYDKWNKTKMVIVEVDGMFNDQLFKKTSAKYIAVNIINS